MPAFSANMQDARQWRDSLPPWQSFPNERAGRRHGVAPIAPLTGNHQARQSRPVQIAASSPCQSLVQFPTSATRLLGDHAALFPIPSYETIQRDSPVDDNRDAHPPTYDPKWERLPTYRAARGASQMVEGRRAIDFGSTPPDYWVGLGDPRTAAPNPIVASGGGGIFFNSPFQHYSLVPDEAIEGGGTRANDRICGMSARRASLVINLSIFALCILVWSSVVLSLNFAEPRLSGSVAARTS